MFVVTSNCEESGELLLWGVFSTEELAEKAARKVVVDRFMDEDEDVPDFKFKKGKWKSYNASVSFKEIEVDKKRRISLRNFGSTQYCH